MRKKVWAAALALAMSVSMTACGGTETGSASSDVSEEADVQEIVSEESTDVGEETDTEEEMTEETNADTDISAFDTDAVIEETILYDENDVVITALGIEYTEYDVELKLEIQNCIYRS